MKQPSVYMMASRRNGTLYVGVSSNLIQRIWQHKDGLADGFANRYGVKVLVWYEIHKTMETAKSREKTIKGWRRVWKLHLIEKTNPHWRDLYNEVLGIAF